MRIGIIGLGYVGLPLAVYMARHFPVTGFDVNKARVGELAQAPRPHRRGDRRGVRRRPHPLLHRRHRGARGCNFYIVTVPTPIDQAKRPDLTALMRASETVGRVLSPGDVVVYESTVYPGATEEVCVPILERASGLAFNRDFFVGYSPERINPGDLQHRLPSIVKVTSGSTPEAADLVDKVYGSVITAGTHKVSSIRVAEAAKVIENIQRDVNIALINELAMLFKDLGLDTREVLAAAGTKWNFHAYRPGLVGGHCIGVDPYYLTHKAQSIGFHPEMILAGRRINDGMAGFVARDIIKAMLRRKLKMDDAKVLVMGFTFKENLPRHAQHQGRRSRARAWQLPRRGGLRSGRRPGGGAPRIWHAASFRRAARRPIPGHRARGEASRDHGARARAPRATCSLPAASSTTSPACLPPGESDACI